jgi:hypothetical protein
MLTIFHYPKTRSLESFLARRKKDASYGGKHIFISHWKA